MHVQMSPLMRQCLDATTRELSEEFRGVFSRETVARCVVESFERIGDRPTVGPNFLPVIIERFARERLWAVAQADGRVEKPLREVLFVCERNAGRSQMAAAFAHPLSNGWVAVRSAGSHPDEQIDPVVVQAMRRARRRCGVRVPEAADGRGRARRRCRRHLRVRGRVRGVSGQAISGLAGRRSRRRADRGRAADSLRALSPRVGAARDARSRRESDRHPPTHRGPALNRVAVITDIHGNLPALEASLQAIGAIGVDAVYCGGDLVGYGPHPERGVPADRGARDPDDLRQLRLRDRPRARRLRLRVRHPA